MLYVFYVETVPAPKTILRINYLRTQVSTIVSGRDGPYHRPYLGGAQTKRIDVIPTPWAMTHALGLTRFPPQHESLALCERAKKVTGWNTQKLTLLGVFRRRWRGNELGMKA